MRASPEIDAYVENAEDWEALHPNEPMSEEINALFGYLSPFHETYGFYIDGVDDTTAMLPLDWRSREVELPVECDGRMVRAVVPERHDLALSKLCRFDPKDREYVEDLHRHDPLDPELLRQRIVAVDAPEEIKSRVYAFVDNLKPAGS